jgi:O-antigen ligase
VPISPSNAADNLSTALDTTGAHRRVATQTSNNALWQSVAFVGALSLAWITLKPFGDLDSSDALDVSTGRETLTYLAFFALAAFCLLQLSQVDRRRLQCLAVPPFLLLAAWVAMTCLASQDVATSLKRATLCGFVAVVAASLMLLPRGRLHLATLLSLAAGSLLALSYFGVIFTPEFAIHQATDVGEPSLAGSWRGVFAHKNDASAVFSMVAFIGIYVARSRRTLVGCLICALSLLFFLLSNGKSSTILCCVAVVVSLLATSDRGRFAIGLVVLAPLLALNALGVGSVLFPTLASISAILPLDATFTGRTEIWQFALAQIPSHPFFGYGFAAFWNSETARSAAANLDSWTGAAAHAHNGYLDVALAMGFPGVAIGFWAFVIQPMNDLHRAMRSNVNAALVLMLAQIWLFGLYLSCVESFFFDRSNPIWVTFLFAVFGLRYVACYKVATP